MKAIEWNKVKDEWLYDTRGIRFQDVAEVIRNDDLITIILNPNQKKYPGQRIYILKLREYIWMVPFVEDEEKIFLKTIYPSRKNTRKFGKE